MKSIGERDKPRANRNLFWDDYANLFNNKPIQTTPNKRVLVRHEILFHLHNLMLSLELGPPRDRKQKYVYGFLLLKYG